MSLLTSSVDLDTISRPESVIPHFPSSQIEHLANLFLAAGDTVSPILLRKISPISFEVLEGHFEYLAALKAQEIDEQFTAIRAYVVPPDLESTILEQYQFLRSHSLPTTTEPQPAREKVPTQQIDLAQLEQSISNHLEQKLSASIDRVVEERVNSSLQVFANQITQQLNAGLLDIKQLLALVPINQAVELAIQTESTPEKITKPKTSRNTTKTKESSSKPKAKSKPSINNDAPSSLQVLNDFNTLSFADLERKLSQFKPSQRKLAQPIYAQRLLQPDHKFQCIEDIINNVSGIKETTMNKIISGW
ncbi:hypothetical protein [Pseudanabaena mucicola]|uniref:Chromosome partitioning protein ParB n=1 Tax=Pseudanabaena mucicola FACHB-723 TaxID=2692860 RepID=A0ABR7ZU51_9CYAN|nr:hypothetical protein [Pseudanabaena mucicola]MBD2187307.1 hypothetical protein [Pseudanabaena mucicola FACHB-723]